MKKLTIEEMNKLVKGRAGKCLSKNYVNAKSNLRWKCKLGHEWEATPSNVKRGTWCHTCKFKSSG